MQNIDIDVVKKLQKYGHLGDLLIPYKGLPNSGKKKVIRLDLFKFFDLFSESFFPPVKIDDIQVVCLFGSTLYKHIPRKSVLETVVKKKYIFFGDISVKNIGKKLPRAQPNDIDLMVISRGDVSLKENNKAEISTLYCREKESGMYSSSSEYKIVGDLPVHIHYRSVSQFLNGINGDDTVSRYVATYGIPFVGQNRFKEILSNIKNNSRDIRHKLKWKNQSRRKLGISCSSKISNCFKRGVGKEAAKEIVAEVPKQEIVSRADLMDLDN
jgi:hypothetical protein